VITVTDAGASVARCSNRDAPMTDGMSAKNRDSAVYAPGLP